MKRSGTPTHGQFLAKRHRSIEAVRNRAFATCLQIPNPKSSRRRMNAILCGTLTKRAGSAAAGLGPENQMRTGLAHRHACHPKILAAACLVG